MNLASGQRSRQLVHALRCDAHLVDADGAPLQTLVLHRGDERLDKVLVCMQAEQLLLQPIAVIQSRGCIRVKLEIAVAPNLGDPGLLIGNEIENARVRDDAGLVLVLWKQHIGLRTTADPLRHRPKSAEIRYVFRTGRNDGIELVPIHQILEASDIGEHLAPA